MKIATLGSKIADDAINYSGGKLVNMARIVELSPLSFIQTVNLPLVPDTQFHVENEYVKSMFFMDFSKAVFTEIEKLEYDYLVIDLAVVRIFVHEFVFEDGSHYRLTENSALQNNIQLVREALISQLGKKIIRERIIDPSRLSDDLLELELKHYAESLKEKFNLSQIVLLEVGNVHEYIDKAGNIALLPNIEIIRKTNEFYEKCKTIFSKYFTCKTIQKPQNLIGNERQKPANMFNFSLHYYTYVMESMLALDEDDFASVNKNLLAKYEVKQHVEIEEAMFKPLLYQTNLKRKNRKLVLVGPSDVFVYLLRKQYGLVIDKVIDYTEDGNMELVEQQLDDIHEKSDEYFCCVPFIYPHTDILTRLWKHGYGYAIGYISTAHYPYQLTNFTGIYTDVYHNRIESKVPCNFEVRGAGNEVMIESTGKDFRMILLSECKVCVGKQVKLEENVSLRLYDGVKLMIGDNSIIEKSTHIRGSFFTQTTLGEDCFIGEKSVIFNGDGHAIIDLHSGQNINYAYKNMKPGKNAIVLGKHVYVGSNSFLLSGTELGNETVVRDNSFVNKKFPPNSKIGGQPARLLETEISWR